MADRFDKFTERARRVLALAQEEAQRFNHNYIGTEHFLLGLVREGDGIAARVLSNLGVQLPMVRAAVEAHIGRGEAMILGEIGLTPRAKKVVELAVDEARRLNHHYIGSEHILLGLVCEGEGTAAQVLTGLGVSLNRLRTQVIQVLSQGGTGPGQAGGLYSPPGSQLPIGPDTPPELAEALRELGALRNELDAALTASDLDRASALREAERQMKERIGEMVKAWQRERPGRPWQDAGLSGSRTSPLTGDAEQVMTLAQEEAQRFDHHYIGTEHILLGLVRLEGTVARRTLDSLGVDVSKVRSAVEFIIGRGPTMSPGPGGLTGRGQRVIDLAGDEARRLNHRAIAPEHLLLGLIREGEGIAAGVLESLGVQLDKTRAQVIQQLIQTPRLVPPRPVPKPMGFLAPSDREPLGELLDVLPVAARSERGATAITLLAIERYDNGFIATIRLLITGPHHLPAEFSVVGKDDGGRQYRAGIFVGSGAGSLERFEQRLAYRFTPALNPAARELTITLAAGRSALEQSALIREPPPPPWTFTIPLPGGVPPGA